MNIGTTLLIAMALVTGLAVGCTGDSPSVSGTSERVMSSTSGRVILVDDLLDTPFKRLREYRIDGLPGATAVIYGFLRDDSNAYDYEVRFYETHDTAVAFGTSLAEEGSGPNAVIRKEDAMYKEGIKDRRVVTGGMEGAIEGGSVGPKYGGYVIYENLILLCQGFELEQSIERCNLLTSVLSLNE